MPVVTRGPPTPLAKQSQRVGEVGVPRWSCLCHEAHSTGRRAAFCTLCSFRPSSLRSSTASVTSYTTLKPKPKASCSSRRLRGCPGSAPRTGPRLKELGFRLDVEGFRDQRNLVVHDVREEGKDSLFRHDAPGSPQRIPRRLTHCFHFATEMKCTELARVRTVSFNKFGCESTTVRPSTSVAPASSAFCTNSFGNGSARQRELEGDAAQSRPRRASP